MSNTTIRRSDCLCGVCAVLATATPTLHTHASQRAAEQCTQPGCVPPARVRWWRDQPQQPPISELWRSS